MRNIKSLLILFFVLLFDRVAFSSTYQIFITSKASKLDDKVLLEVSITNKGNQIATNVSVDIFKDNEVIKTEIFGDLRPGSTITKNNIEISLEREKSVNIIPCLLRYTTAQHIENSSPFIVTVDESTLDPYLKLEANEIKIADFAYPKISIKNQDIHRKTVTIRLLVPKEFRVDYEPQTLILYPNKSEKVKFRLMNKWSNPGSIYPAYILAEDESGNIRRAQAFQIKVISYQELGSGYLNLLYALLILVGIWEASKGLAGDN